MENYITRKFYIKAMKPGIATSRVFTFLIPYALSWEILIPKLWPVSEARPVVVTFIASCRAATTDATNEGSVSSSNISISGYELAELWDGFKSGVI